MSAPERSLVQRMDALQRANEIRTKRAVLKRDLKSGKASMFDLLLEPPLIIHSAKVFDLLLCAPKYGRVKTNKVLQLCRISPTKTIGGLSPRQRTELASMLRRPAHSFAPSTRTRVQSVTDGQHLRALKTANTVRLGRAEIKQQIATGYLTVPDVLSLRPEVMETITVADLLMSQRRWGRTRTRRLLASMPMLETKSVGSMTDRQRNELVRRLSGDDLQGWELVA